MHDIVMLYVPDPEYFEKLKQHLRCIVDNDFTGRLEGSEWNFPCNLLALTKVAGSNSCILTKEAYSMGEKTYEILPEIATELLVIPSCEAVVIHVKQSCCRIELRA